MGHSCKDPATAKGLSSLPHRRSFCCVNEAQSPSMDSMSGSSAASQARTGSYTPPTCRSPICTTCSTTLSGVNELVKPASRTRAPVRPRRVPRATAAGLPCGREHGGCTTRKPASWRTASSRGTAGLQALCDIRDASLGGVACLGKVAVQDPDLFLPRLCISPSLLMHAEGSKATMAGLG